MSLTKVPTSMITPPLNGATGSAQIGFVSTGLADEVRTVESKLRDFVNIRDFGAKGDGVTNDTQAFDFAVADGRMVVITNGSYYLTKTYSGANNFIILGKVTWTNANFRVIPTFNTYGNLTARMQSSMTTGRQELQIYSSATGAFSTGSRGAGMHLYGNGDSEHAGNFAFMTGQDDQGTARMIISGGSNNPSSNGYRTNTDTRVTIGNDIWDFVDDGLDTGLLTLKNPIDRPAIYITDTSATEGELAVPDGERLDFGHWDGTSTFVSRLAFNAAGNLQPGESDNTQSCGTSDRRWSVVYAGTGTINTSDANEKQDIDALSEAEQRVATRIKSLVKKFRFRDAVREKQDNARIHVGVIAQEVQAAFEAEGLDAARYGMFCSNQHEDGSTRLGVRYEELLAFIIAAI
jgi:hypothetical protein